MSGLVERLRPQYCTGTADAGDCYRACVATITKLDASTMPNFQHLPGVKNGYDGLANARAWLARHGLSIFDTWVSDEMTLEQVLADCSAFNPGIPIILSGWSQRGNDNHSVVVLDGTIAHDPSGVGIDRPSPCQCGEEDCSRAAWYLEVILSTPDHTEALEREVERLEKAAKVQMDGKHAAEAEAKLWFEKYQALTNTGKSDD